MWTMLAGVPGKLKTLIDRLTATRAANLDGLTATRTGYLDRLDATISSRAAASTALSTATWTNARAAQLDLIKTDPTMSPPAAGGLIAAAGTNDGTLNLRAAHVGGVLYTATSTSLVTALSLTGAGVLNFLCVECGSDNGAQIVITIDGVVAMNSTFAGTAAKYTLINIVGAYYSVSTSRFTFALDQVPFRSSLVVQVRCTAGSRSLDVLSKYRMVTL